MKNTGILHAGQLTDHAKKPDTEVQLIIKSLFLNGFIKIKSLARAMQSLLHDPQPCKELNND